MPKSTNLYVHVQCMKIYIWKKTKCYGHKNKMVPQSTLLHDDIILVRYSSSKSGK